MVHKSAIIGRQSNPNKQQRSLQEMQQRQSRCFWQESILFMRHIFISLLVLLLILSIGQSTALVRRMGNPKTPSSLTYDVAIVGGGSAGLTAAKLAGKTFEKVYIEFRGGSTWWRLHVER
jgi:hypothetical protein